MIDESSLLRLYCGFAGYLHLPAESEELEIFLHIMKNSTNPRTLTIGLCYLLLCPNLKEVVGKEDIVSTLKRLKDRAVSKESESGTDTEILLLLAIFFHTQQPVSRITTLVVDTLNINLKLSNEKALAEIKEIFTKEVFQEKLLAEFVLSLPPSKDLQSTTRSVPLTCIFGLLQGRIFQAHDLDVRPWIQRQIFETRDSVHPLLPALLQDYVRAVVVEGAPRITRIADQVIIQAFTGIPEKVTVAQVLLAFYVLAFNSQVQSQKMKTLTPLAEYPFEVLDVIPVKKIMRQIEGKEAFVNIYPLLLSLTVTQLPTLFGTRTTLFEEDLDEGRRGGSGSALEQKLKSVQLLWQLSRLDSGTTWPPSPDTIESLLCQSLENPPVGLMGEHLFFFVIFFFLFFSCLLFTFFFFSFFLLLLFSL